MCKLVNIIRKGNTATLQSNEKDMNYLVSEITFQTSLHSTEYIIQEDLEQQTRKSVKKQLRHAKWPVVDLEVCKIHVAIAPRTNGLLDLKPVEVVVENACHLEVVHGFVPRNRLGLTFLEDEFLQQRVILGIPCVKP